MRFKLYDPDYGFYYVVAEVVSWYDGVLTITTSSSDFRVICTKREWRSINFWFWFGYCYIDLTGNPPA